MRPDQKIGTGKQYFQACDVNFECSKHTMLLSICVLKLISGKGDVTISMDDEGLLQLMTGQLNPQQVSNEIRNLV